MLIWVNGPFGGGKTQAAYELRRRLPDSVVCDPELVGFSLQRMTPPALRPDFQEFRAWRSGVLEVLDWTLGGQAGPVIAPMTLVEPAYFSSRGSGPPRGTGAGAARPRGRPAARRDARGAPGRGGLR